METLEEVGKRLSVSRERARQIEESALKKLRHSKSTRAFAIYMDDPGKALDFLDNENMVRPKYKYNGRTDMPAINPYKSYSYKPGKPKPTMPRVVKPKVVTEKKFIDAYEITSEDEERLSELIGSDELQSFQTIIFLRRFIIIMLYSGFINMKKFSISTIAEYLDISVEEVEATVNSVTKYYGSYINRILEETNNSTLKKV